MCSSVIPSLSDPEKSSFPQDCLVVLLLDFLSMYLIQFRIQCNSEICLIIPNLTSKILVSHLIFPADIGDFS